MCQSFAFARLNYALLNLVSKMLVECGSPSVKMIYKKDGSTCIHSVYTSHSAPGVKSGGVSGSDCAKAVCPDVRLHALLAEGPAQGDDWSGQQRRPASTQFWLATPDYCYSLPAAAAMLMAVLLQPQLKLPCRPDPPGAGLNGQWRRHCGAGAAPRQSVRALTNLSVRALASSSSFCQSEL